MHESEKADYLSKPKFWSIPESSNGGVTFATSWVRSSGVPGSGVQLCCGIEVSDTVARFGGVAGGWSVSSDASSIGAGMPQKGRIRCKLGANSEPKTPQNCWAPGPGHKSACDWPTSLRDDSNECDRLSRAGPVTFFEAWRLSLINELHRCNTVAYFLFRSSLQCPPNYGFLKGLLQ